MSNDHLPLELAVITDNAPGLQPEHIATHDQNMRRTGSIHFEYQQDRYRVRAWGDIFPDDGLGQYEGFLLRDKHTIFAAIENCRKVWQKNVIDLEVPSGTGNRLPFVDAWDLSSGPDRDCLDRVGLKLARAGNDLFKILFRQGDEGLSEISDRLTAALAAKEQVLAFHSTDLFAPWWMLYTPIPGTKLVGPAPSWSLDGFWGYRHLIEHLVRRVRNESRIVVMPRQIRVGLNVDPRVDEDLAAPFVESVVAFFRENVQEPVVRETKATLRDAIEAGEFADQIIYFGCHGVVSGAEAEPQLSLSDDDPIVATDFIAWLDRRSFASNPIVFVNACQGGQMQSHFYTSFGVELLKCGANCLIGPQVDLPARFGAEYASRLFQQLFRPNTRLGDVAHNLTQEFADRYRNPLGLIFSLYRGLDTHFVEATS